ncbi:MAG: helix-turn-helix transcriptional regulator [Pirellulales bacterium]|nr:helix-turn-helix transcriptional regulator [Pirellulales bacterium]
MPSLVEDYFRYLPVSTRDKQWGLYVTGVGCSGVPVGSPYPRSMHPGQYHFAWQKGRVLPEYQILYVTWGEGEFESKAVPLQRISAGTVLLLFPGVWHNYRPIPQIGWEEYWVSFGGPRADDLLLAGFFSPERAILKTGPDDAVLRPYMQMLNYVKTEPSGYRQMIAAATVEILAAAIGAAQRRRDGGRLEGLVRQARLIMERDLEEVIDMEDVARSLGMSYAHFRRVFKQQTGFSPYQYHLQLRVHRARELLRGTNLSVKEIATRLNFESPYHFSRMFKKKTAGMSPTQWRGGGESPRETI